MRGSQDYRPRYPRSPPDSLPCGNPFREHRTTHHQQENTERPPPVDLLRRPSRRLATEEERANIRVVKKTGACLRCKIHKKQCDGGNPCKQCPLPAVDSIGDFWKAIGCHREIESLLDIFIPAWLEQDSREFHHVMGHHRYTLQLSAKSRPLESEFYGNSPLGALSDDFWINRYTRNDWNSPVTAIRQDESKFYERSIPAARELIALCLLHPTFEQETAYSPFNLLRNIEHAENRLSTYKHYHIFRHNIIEREHGNLLKLSREIIVEACAGYQREYRCCSSADEIEQHVDLTIDVGHYSTPTLSRNLNACLRIFGASCSSRYSIYALYWPSIFYFICALNIVHSILIDTRMLQYPYTSSSSPVEQDIHRIQSVYMAVVSNFGWACGSFDPMIKDDSFQEDSLLEENFQEARSLVQVEKWKSRNIKSTKDFLMKLGKGKFINGACNGFFVPAYAHLTGPPADIISILPESGPRRWSLEDRNPSKPTGIVSRTFNAGKSSFATLPHSQHSGRSFDMSSPAEMQYSSPYSGKVLEKSAEVSAVFRTEMEEPESVVLESLLDLQMDNDDHTFEPFFQLIGSKEEERMGHKKQLVNLQTRLGNTTPGFQEDKFPRRSHDLEQDSVRTSQNLSKQDNIAPPLPSTVAVKVTVNQIFGGYQSPGLRSATSSLRSGGSVMSITSLSKEDVIMSGLSPSSWKSHASSNQSISSLRKVEASLMKDFRCCNKSLATFHDLRAHYDACHGQSEARKAPPNGGFSNVENGQGELDATLMEVAKISL